MLLSQENSLLPKCKVAKHMLSPKISYGDINTKLSHGVIRFSWPGPNYTKLYIFSAFVP